MEEGKKESYPCRECQVGSLQSRPVSYFTVQDGQLISVPDFPAWVCDVCGRREYDQRAITWLVTMLNPETGKPAAARRRLRPPQKRRNVTHTRPPE